MTFEVVKVRGLTIGLLDPDAGVYRVERRYPGDVARKLNAYGIDCTALEAAKARGVHTVELDEHRGQALRRYSHPIEDWLTSYKGSLPNGLPHYFLPLRELGPAVVLRAEACGRRMLCCGGGSCAEPVGHFRAQPQHRCGKCGDRRSN